MSKPSPPRTVAVATSIPPRLARQNAGRPINEDYQKLCVRSWVDAGFRILSVNDPEEIPALAEKYPDVQFVPTERNASRWTGRKNPYIADMLLALKDAHEPAIGIINSDLVFETTSAWGERLPSLVANAAVIGQRYDATSLTDGTFRRFWPGFDFFFFDASLAESLTEVAMPFAMGVPFWDYWLPIAAAFQNRRIQIADRPCTVHLMHNPGYPEAVLSAYAKIFAQFTLAQAEAATEAVPDFVSAILPACRDIAALDEGRDEIAILKKCTDVLSAFIPLIRKHGSGFDSETSPADDTGSSSVQNDGPLTPARVFHRFKERFGAGETLERAKVLHQEQNICPTRSVNSGTP